jgi:hypothetical protein
MDVEVGINISKCLVKLETLSANTNITINAGDTDVTEEMAIMIAKRLPQLKEFVINHYSIHNILGLKQRLKKVLPSADLSADWHTIY